MKYGTVNLKDITVIHLKGDFDSVLNLLQGQVTSDCTLITQQLGQTSSLCNEKGFILCNFEIVFDRNKWLIIIEKAQKDIFLDEITKYLPFYKVSAELLSYKVIGFVKKKHQAMLPNEHLILNSDVATLSLLINTDNEYLDGDDPMSMDHWCINRKIMGDHLIQLQETGKYRPHELG